MYDKDVFVIDKDKTTPKNSFESRTIYTMKNMEDSIDNDYPIISNIDEKSIDDLRAFAYKNTGEVHEKYYVKINNFGQYIDPVDKSHMANLEKTKDSLKIWRWRQINRASFEEYIEYLRTQNKTHYTQSVRLI